MFSFSPLSDDQINELQNRDLLSDGVYSFVVRGIEQQMSQTTNFPMLKVTLGVTSNKDNSIHFVVDYLTTSEKMMFKLKHFCETIGMEDDYTKGKLQPGACLNRAGRVKIATQKGTAKPDGSGFYPDKNIAKDYVKLELVEPTLGAAIDPKFNDDIMF